MIQTKNLPGRGPATRSIVAVSRLVALSAVRHLSVITPVSPATRLEAAQAEDTVTVFGHPVYIFEFSDAGFTPSTLRTSPGTAAIFIRNLTNLPRGCPGLQAGEESRPPGRGRFPVPRPLS